MKSYNVYQCIIIKETEDNTTIIKDVYTIVATSEDKARTIASRDIPEEYLSDLDSVKIIIRPF